MILAAPGMIEGLNTEHRAVTDRVLFVAMTNVRENVKSFP